MDTTIVVIGSVTAKQYRPLRLEQLRQGYKPKIVRLHIEPTENPYEEPEKAWATVGQFKGLKEVVAVMFDVKTWEALRHDGPFDGGMLELDGNASGVIELLGVNEQGIVGELPSDKPGWPY